MHLLLRGSAPLFVYSTAPLTSSDGRPVQPPTPGAGGYSLALSDKQVGSVRQDAGPGRTGVRRGTQACALLPIAALCATCRQRCTTYAPL